MKEWMIQMYDKSLDPDEGYPIGWVNAYGNVFLTNNQEPITYNL